MTKVYIFRLSENGGQGLRDHLQGFQTEGVGEDIAGRGQISLDGMAKRIHTRLGRQVQRQQKAKLRVQNS